MEDKEEKEKEEEEDEKEEKGHPPPAFRSTAGYQAALQSEYPLTRIASVTFTFVAGSAVHAMKKCAAFSVQSSTFYSFLSKKC